MAPARKKAALKRGRTKFHIDPAHEGLNIYSGNSRGGAAEPFNPITLDIWLDKYHWGDEEHPHDSMRRVVEGVYAYDSDTEAKRLALTAMEQALWIPAGRIHAGAGTPNRVTLLNCFMCQDIDDSMQGIADALKDAMLTMQQGGGIGMNFSSLRPSGAHLQRTGAVASGPLPFMDMWNSMCATIMSAGSRRGAMMATMSDDHPDLPAFITAKHEKGRLTNFNVSVMISDAFMDAVQNNEDWFLGFNTPRADGRHLFVTHRDDGTSWYAYEKWSARELWDLILQNTYEWSEPGVIFIDRVNDWNNLAYMETITGTNPCGEQPLPPDGCCNLGAVNLARMVQDPFTEDARFDFQLLKQITSIGVRFLDNVIDVTRYPLPSQEVEEHTKRRIGIGITGLANALAQMGLRYGSPDSIELTDKIMRTLKETAYTASSVLARDRGSFPGYDYQLWGDNSPVVQSLPRTIQNRIKKWGVRNGVLLTIAPTGTTSLYAGNVSSGLEPVFLHETQRRVRQGDDSYKTYQVYDYGYLLYKYVKGYTAEEHPPLPEYMVTHEDLTVLDHLRMQAACQAHVDASVSKTINCRQEIDFEDFKSVYEYAYSEGLKGCTTYRYSAVRDSVLGPPKDEAKEEPINLELTPRPDVLSGKTYKIKWPSISENYYITINESKGRPYELFIQSTSSKYSDWTTALALMVSAIMRRGDDISFIPEELAKVISTDDSAWINGKFYGSLVGAIGETIQLHLDSLLPHMAEPEVLVEAVAAEEIQKGDLVRIKLEAKPPRGQICPECNMPTLIPIEGCNRCINCSYSNCG